MLISKEYGNWLFLACVLTRLEIEPDEPLRPDAPRSGGEEPAGLLCGKCTRCLDACPTDAFAAPGVVVSYTDDPEIQNGKKFAAQGLQIAAGVPLQCDEGPDYRSFRLGLFGLDKLKDVPASIGRLAEAFNAVLG